MTTRFDFIRHGEPQGGSLYRGSAIDDPLSEKGWQQMWAALGKHNHWDQIVSSPLLRCLEFAQALASKHDLPVTVKEGFREVGFGVWEGCSPELVRRNHPREYQAFYADPVNCRPQGAEDLMQFGQRVADALEQLVLEFEGMNLLVIAHAGVIRASLGHVMQAPAASWYRAKVNNACISRFQFGASGSQLIFHNLPALQVQEMYQPG